jgi:methyltransferase (TIGR00027 family)
MIETTSPVRSVSDTARWVAYFRARENERPDALFRDSYAARLAGERGFQIANTLPDGNNNEWAWVARTYLFDKFLSAEIEKGADLVLNLAAGLDARPYRMDIPASLHWVELDFPEIVSYKEEILAGEKPKCKLERVSLDLSDERARRELFADLNSRAKKIVVLTEGLLIYFAPEQVATLAEDLALGTHFERWIIDLASPGQLRLMQRTSGVQLSEAGAAFKFGPPEGAKFFSAHGWKPRDVQGLLKTAAQFKRSPKGLLPMNVDSLEGVPANFPWTGVCLLSRP